MNSKRRLNQARGFTVMEIMVVLAIIAILGAVTIPLYHNYQRRAEVLGAFDLSESLRTAVIVDDSASIRSRLKGILEEIGIKVVCSATSGKEAVQLVTQSHPALVCLDVDMPVMTGIEAIREVRAASLQSKVVMITGNTSRAIVERAVSGGVKGYFLKPIRPAKVEEFMRKLMALQ